MITVQQVNQHFSGDPGKLMRRVVDTPNGQGVIRAVAGAGREWQAEVVTGRRKRQWFSFNDLDFAVNYANAVALGWEE